MHRARDGTCCEVGGTDGPAIVLVHGLGINRQMWRYQVAALTRRYRVITYDLFGHGDSPKPPAPPSLSLFSLQLLRLLDDLNIGKVAVLGFSLGGMIARRFAMDHAERLWALGILHSAHRRTTTEHDAVQARVRQARQEGPQATVDAALQRWFSDDFRTRCPEIPGQVRRWVLANDRQVYPDIYQVLVDGVDEIAAPQKPASCPTLVMTGDEDLGNSPSMSRAIADEIPGAKLVILPHLRHMAMMESPDLFNREILSFLDQAGGA